MAKPRRIASKPRPSTARQVAALKRTAARSIAAAPQTELRALTIFDKLPADHCTFAVTSDGAEPHLRVGEFAVIDATDREPQHGELYLIQYESGARRRDLVQVRSDYANITGPGAPDLLVWWVGDLRGYRSTGKQVLGGIPEFTGLSDGPYQTHHLRSKLIGRVVGVAFSHLGGQLAAEAGYENEAKGNAAFDPAEYIDTLTATGHRITLLGNSFYEEMPKQPMTKNERAAVMAVRIKLSKASTGIARVMQQFARRGLIENGRAV